MVLYYVFREPHVQCGVFLFDLYYVATDVLLTPMNKLSSLSKQKKDKTMARQIQIRRGTTLENDNFTGAVGEITMDTDAKTLRVHDGETIGGVALARASDIMGDYVIETQLPTEENNYTWYRKYKSGWVEMGGEINGTQTNADITITLPIIMANNHYTLIRTQVASNIQSYYPGWVAGYTSKTETDFKFTQVSGTNIWYVCGQSK